MSVNIWIISLDTWPLGQTASARMCEGDIAVLMNIMKKMSNEISELRSKLVAVARDVRAIQSRPPEPFPALPEPTL